MVHDYSSASSERDLQVSSDGASPFPKHYPRMQVRPRYCISCDHFFLLKLICFFFFLPKTSSVQTTANKKPKALNAPSQDRASLERDVSLRTFLHVSSSLTGTIMFWVLLHRLSSFICVYNKKSLWEWC